MEDVGVDEALHFGRIVARSHIDEAVFIRHYAVSAVVAEDNEAVTDVLCDLSVSIILKGVNDVSAHVGDRHRASAHIEVVCLEAAQLFLTDETKTVYVLRYDAVRILNKYITFFCRLQVIKTPHLNQVRRKNIFLFAYINFVELLSTRHHFV